MSSLLLLLALVPAAPIPAHPERVAAPAVAAPSDETTLADLARFPGLTAAKENLASADAHILWLEGQSSLSPWLATQLWPWLEEARALRERWLWLVEAHAQPTEEHPDGCTTDSWRLENLDFLRHALGEERWRAGWMPPPVPVWRFREAR